MSEVYYPLVAVIFTMRFDELLLNGGIPKLVNAESLGKQGGASGGPPSEKPALLSGAKDRLSKKIGIIPRTASLELPGYRQAPKFNLAMAWRDLPLDPRAVRALGVEIYVGTVKSDAFARTMLFKDDYSKVVKELTDNPDNLMLAGVTDTINTSFNEKGSELTLEGRGLQGIFLDARVHPESLKDLKVDQDIESLIDTLLSRCGLSNKIPVKADPADQWPNKQLPKVAAADFISRVNKGRDGNKTHATPKGDNSTMSFWDIATWYCYLVGAVPYFEGHTLRIRPAVNLYKVQQSDKTPFKDGKKRSEKKGGKEFSIRRMVYGRNLASFNLSRKTAGASKLPTVRVVCVNPDAGRGKDKLLEVRYPADSADDKQKATDVSPDGSQSKQELMTVPVHGITSKVRLGEIAQALYEEIARGEISGTASTKDLASLGGDNEDADLLHLRPGDPVDFFVDASGLRVFPPVISEANNLAAQSPAEAKRLLAEQLGDRDLAELIIDTSRGQFQGLQSTFHVQTVKYSWDVNNGVGVDFDFQNYVEARFDRQAKQQTPSDVAFNISNALDDIETKLKKQQPSKSSVATTEE